MTVRKRRKTPASLLLALTLAAGWPAAEAGPLRDRIAGMRDWRSAGDLQEGDELPGASRSLPAGTRVFRDVAYGSDGRQRFDVYAPARAGAAPVLFLVHGGGWARGDKAAPSVVDNKVAHWLPQGFIVVSINYRMLPQADPLEQARDVARALAAAQERAGGWGGDPARFVLLGHSAGAHLAALLSASPALAAEAGARPWLGAVLLDSAALDLVQIMESRHLGLYDRAFGSDPAFWRAASPFHALAKAGPPVLAVCSSRRGEACPQARRFAARASSLGMRATVLAEDLSHREINVQLGLDGPYTQAVDDFLASLLPAARPGSPAP